MKNFNGPKYQQGFWQGAAAAGIAGVASIFGASSANRAAKAEAQRNRDFQERMSSTAHQREVADLRQAGLNPILSATGGPGASTPGGAMAQIRDEITPAISSAMQARSVNATIKQIKSTIKNIDADTHVKRQMEATEISKQIHNYTASSQQETQNLILRQQLIGETLHGQLNLSKAGPWFTILDRILPTAKTILGGAAGFALGRGGKRKLK